ncbi:hypothetical protein ACJZ2D_006275 [Fusarium nematophilum]
MFDCAQVLLDSASDIQQDASRLHVTRELHETPSSPCLRRGTPCSSPRKGSYSSAHHKPLEPQSEPALLYHWFCIFWDTFCSSNTDTGRLPTQDCFDIEQMLPLDAFDSPQILPQDPLDFHQWPSAFQPFPLETYIPNPRPLSWMPLSPYSDSTSSSGNDKGNG